jgi:hypothetical protein
LPSGSVHDQVQAQRSGFLNKPAILGSGKLTG